MKNQKIKRQERARERVPEVTQSNAGDEQNASRNARAGDGGAKVGLKNNQPEKRHSGHNRRNQRIAPVVHGVSLVFEKPREKQDERGLRQFRRLQRNRAHMKPAMRAVGAIKKKNGDEQKRRKSEKQENQRRMLQAFVVHLRGHHHHGESRNRPYQLLQQEFVSRPVALLGHHSGGAEDHEQSDKNQNRRHGEHPAIDADPLSHRESISPRTHEDMEEFRRGFWAGDN